MRKVARGLCALLALLLCLGTWTVYAADVSLALDDAKITDGVLTLTGSLADATVLKCSVTVFLATGVSDSAFDYSAMSPQEIIESQTQLIAEGRLLDMAEVATDRNGKLSYTLDLKRFGADRVGEGDFVRITVRAKGMLRSVSAKVYYSGANDAQIALGDVARSTPEEMLAHFAGETVEGQAPVSGILGFEVDGFYTVLSPAGKLEVATAIAGQNFGTAETARTSFNTAVATAAKKEIFFGSAYHGNAVVDVFDLLATVQSKGMSFASCPAADTDMSKTIDQKDVSAVLDMILKAYQ